MMAAQYVAVLLSCQSLHECPDVCFVDHVVGVMAKLEPTAHNHAVALAHGFPGCFKRHPCTHDHGKFAQSGLKLFHLLHRGLHTGAASRADHGVAAFLANERSIMDGTFKSTLIKSISQRQREAYRRCSDVAYDKIYRSKPVLDVELAGYRVMTTLMEQLIDAAINPNRFYSQQ